MNRVCEILGITKPVVQVPMTWFYFGMLKGDMEAGINTVSSAAGLIKSIDTCKEIVNELARGYGC